MSASELNLRRQTVHCVWMTCVGTHTHAHVCSYSLLSNSWNFWESHKNVKQGATWWLRLKHVINNGTDSQLLSYYNSIIVIYYCTKLAISCYEHLLLLLHQLIMNGADRTSQRCVKVSMEQVAATHGSEWDQSKPLHNHQQPTSSAVPVHYVCHTNLHQASRQPSTTNIICCAGTLCLSH